MIINTEPLLKYRTHRISKGRNTCLKIMNEKKLGIIVILKNNFTSRENQSWYKGETVIAGIGQGYMLATPLQLA